MGTVRPDQTVFYFDFDGILSDTIVDLEGDQLKVAIGCGILFTDIVGEGDGLEMFNELLEISIVDSRYNFRPEGISTAYGLDETFRREISKQKFAFIRKHKIYTEVQVNNDWSAFDDGKNVLVSKYDSSLDRWNGPKIKYTGEETTLKEIKKYLDNSCLAG
jgi:hypothetical protein